MTEEPEYKMYNISDKWGKKCYYLAEAYREAIPRMSSDGIKDLKNMAQELYLEIGDSCESIDELSEGDRELCKAIHIIAGDLCDMLERMKECRACYFDHWEYLMSISNTKCIAKGSAREMSDKYFE